MLFLTHHVLVSGLCKLSLPLSFFSVRERMAVTIQKKSKYKVFSLSGLMRGPIRATYRGAWPPAPSTIPLPLLTAVLPISHGLQKI